jgi:hypothetical protein
MRNLVVAGFLMLLASCATFAPVPPDAQSVSEYFVGLCPSPGNPSSSEWTTYDSWGTKWARQGFFWDSVEPEPGQFHWAWMDSYVAHAQAHGMRVLAVLDYDTPWIFHGNEPHKRIGPRQLSAYLSYVRAVAERYKGRIAAYEIWNEPNLGIFWQGSQKEYADMALAATKTLHQIDPSAKVCVGALSLVPHDWLETLAASGVLAQADFLSIHPYWLDAQGSLKQLDDAQAFLRRHHLETRLLVSEVGYPTGGLYPTATTPAGQALRLLQFYSGAAARGVKAVFWYESNDQDQPQAWNSEAYFGLVGAGGRDKPGVDALKVAEQTLAGSLYQPGRFSAQGSEADKLSFLTFHHPDGTTAVFVQNRGGDKILLKCLEGTRMLWNSESGRSTPTPSVRQVLLAPWGLAVLEEPF